MKDTLSILVEYFNILQKGECTEELIDKAFRNLGYKNPKDYLTVDEACNYLHISRATFYSLIPKYKIVNEKFKNNPAGYYKPYLHKIKKDLEKTT